MTAASTPRQAIRDAARSIRRDAAVAAATQLFAAQGFHATGMADVAARAGLSLKALYAAFPGKDELFAAVLHDVGARFVGLVGPPDPDTTAEEAVVDIIDRLLELTAQNIDALRLYARGADGIPPALRERGVDPFADFTRTLLTSVVARVEAAQAERGEARADAAVTARALVALAIAEARARVDAGEDVAGAVAALRPVVLAIVRGC